MIFSACSASAVCVCPALLLWWWCLAAARKYLSELLASLTWVSVLSQARVPIPFSDVQNYTEAYEAQRASFVTFMANKGLDKAPFAVSYASGDAAHWLLMSNCAALHRNNTQTPLVFVALTGPEFVKCTGTLAPEFGVHCFNSNFSAIRGSLGPPSNNKLWQPWVAGKPLAIALAVVIPQVWRREEPIWISHAACCASQKVAERESRIPLSSCNPLCVAYTPRKKKD